MCSEPVTFGGGMTIEKGLRARLGAGAGLERAGLLPGLVDARLDGGRVVGLVEHVRFPGFTRMSWLPGV